MSERDRHEPLTPAEALRLYLDDSRRVINSLQEVRNALADLNLYGRKVSAILQDEAAAPLLGVGLSRSEVLAYFGVPERLMDPPPVLKGYDEPPPFPAALDPRRCR